MKQLAAQMSQINTQLSSTSIVIIGGGVAGATAAVHLSEIGQNVTLIERGASLVSGPPICHLHAGGNLYREISTEQCIELLEQSIETVRLYPQTINRRPTLIAVPISDPGSVDEVESRLQTIRDCYQTLVDRDPANQVLGAPQDYYRCFSKEELQALATRTQPEAPNSVEDWVIPFAQHADLDALKYPVVAVQEHGWSVFRLAASAKLTLAAHPNCQLLTSCEVTDLEESGDGWLIRYRDDNNRLHELQAQYVINACGYQTGTIDDLAQKKRQRLVEFKAAYVTRWAECDQVWPEVIFHGQRGTPAGMAQLTPYANKVFQLHGMTKEITLFDEGLVASDDHSSQPQLPAPLIKTLNQGWDESVAKERSLRAVRHIGQYVPDYHSADYYALPLYGAQQIPGRDDSLRAADVSFEANHYARIEVVKGSSALEAARKVVTQWGLYDYRGASIEALHPVCTRLVASDVEQEAKRIAIERGYPAELAQVYGESQ